VTASPNPVRPPPGIVSYNCFVSALCVSHLKNLPALFRSVACFMKQTYPENIRELVIVFDTGVEPVCARWAQSLSLSLSLSLSPPPRGYCAVGWLCEISCGRSLP
jgi:hypothetical protein